MTLQVPHPTAARGGVPLRCAVVGHGTDIKRHDNGQATAWVRNFHGCWGAPMVPVCDRFSRWVTDHREDIGRCRVCGETRAVQDWAYVIRAIEN